MSANMRTHPRYRWSTCERVCSTDRFTPIRGFIAFGAENQRLLRIAGLFDGRLNEMHINLISSSKIITASSAQGLP